jgi:large subunit ribosomal protein L4
MKIELYNNSGKKTDKKVDLNDDIFKIVPNDHSIYLAVNSERASSRQGTHSSKTKGEVRGSGRKPWKQKGTGRARIGTISNSSWEHGGSAFGPKPHLYFKDVNKKVKKLARKSVLSKMASDSLIKVFEKFDFSSHKTKDMQSFLNNLELGNEKVIMLVGKTVSDNMRLAARNLHKVQVKYALNVSTLDLMSSSYILIDKEGVTKLNSL